MIDFGVSPDEFTAEYFERRHLLRRRALAMNPFGWKELDAILYSIDPSAPSLQLYADGPVDESAFTEACVEFGVPRRRLAKARFLRLLHAGATLVINRMESHSLPIRHLCSEVGRFAGSVPVSNAYLSLGGSGTFGKHWDTHDVFVLQLIGRKRWQVFAPTFPLPLSEHRSTGLEAQCSDMPLLDTTLEAGDLLYLPRGFWHRAIPLAEPSLHLSVGTYGPTMHDYVSWVCANRLPSLEAVRHSLDGSPRRDMLERVVERFGEELLSPTNLDAFDAQLRAREQRPVEFNTGVFFATGPAGLSPEAVVALNGFRRRGADSGESRHSKHRPQLDPVGRRIIDTVSSHAGVSLAALCEALPDVDPETVRLAVLDLELNERVTVFQPR